ncbi:helix-turn-helix transcriptional regulator [Jeotgalibacillus malaysiensis]|uniref:helix-turn-helix transcriptional regulator n=1 Tax=Jeotgalibacillus malaysiensis TaxID=1508404 RepID=UPI00384F8B8B
MKNDRLIQARLEKGFTQEKLGEMVGYTKATVSNWETGFSTPRTKDAIKVARILEKDVDHLFYNQKEQDSHTHKIS